MRPAANMHTHDFRSGTFDITYQARQHFEILAPFCPRLVLRAAPSLFFCETQMQLIFSELVFNVLARCLSTEVLRVRGLKLLLSWGLDESSSLDGLGFFAAMVKVDWVSVDGAGVGDWIHTRRENVDRHWR